MSEEENKKTKNPLSTILYVSGALVAAAATYGLYYFRNAVFSQDNDKSTKSNKPHLWLREETKKGERRTALTPENARKLIEAGFKVTVEKSETRIFKDEEYQQVGCTLVDGGSWTSAPLEAIILGLKELPENDSQSLKHTHIFFAHCFKQQKGWKELLQRFEEGKGNLLDLEYLLKDGRRVAAFGATAGMVGAALGVINWVHQQKQSEESFPSCYAWDTKEEMIEDVKSQLGDLRPKTIVFGALGRSGKGVSEILEAAGINPTKWDLEETKSGGPFKEILDYDIMYNCILLVSKIPPFLTLDIVKEKEDRSLSMIVDVSCDTSNPHNPLPFLNVSTDLENPVINVLDDTKGLDAITIDHLPTLLPRESSISFSNDLLPYLLELKNPKSSPVWSGAEKLFKEKLIEANQN